MPHHVITTLPDGRAIRVDYRVPVIVPLIRKIHEETQKPVSRRDHDRLEKLDLAAARWLDEHEDQCCSAEQVRHGTCVLHGEVV